MAIELEIINENSDDPCRVIRYGENRQDYLMAMHTDPELMSDGEFRTAVFDILWQLSGGKYD